MAGDDDRNRVGSIGSTNGPCSAGDADHVGDISITNGLPVGNLSQDLPHTVLESCALGADGDGEVGEFLVEISL